MDRRRRAGEKVERPRRERPDEPIRAASADAGASAAEDGPRSAKAEGSRRSARSDEPRRVSRADKRRAQKAERQRRAEKRPGRAARPERPRRVSRAEKRRAQKAEKQRRGEEAAGRPGRDREGRDAGRAARADRARSERAEARRRALVSARRASRSARRASGEGLRATGAAARGPLRRASRTTGRGTRRARGLATRAGRTTARGLKGAGRRVAILAVAVAAASRRAIDASAKAARPDRVVGLTALAAIVLLIASQFSDYRGVAVGSPFYGAVENVAPAPQTAKANPLSPHSIVLLIVAAAALYVLFRCVVGRRWQLGRVLSGLGAVGVIVSLAIDLPQGLDEGTAARDFAGAHAELLGGFWVQLTASATLVALGLLIAEYVRREGVAKRSSDAAARRPRPARTRRSRLAEGST